MTERVTVKDTLRLLNKRGPAKGTCDFQERHRMHTKVRQEFEGGWI